jgi:DNA-binding IclR family transcriptional regulator
MSTAKNILSILNTFLDHRTQLSISDVVRITGQSRGIVYRMISILEEEEYISRINKRGKYLPGPKFLEFANLLRDLLDIKDLILPFLKKLRDHVDESVYSDVLKDGKSVVNNALEGKQQLRIVPDLYMERPFHCSASGKIYLANMTETEQGRYLSRNKELHSYTSNTITNHSKLRKQLIEIKQEGIAFDREELTPGIIAIACPIKNHVGSVLACIGIIMPAVRATRGRVSELVPLVKNTASEISKIFGYSV